jgi:hypothetical protein
MIDYKAERQRGAVRRIKRTYTRRFFAERAGSGCDVADPIFIVGMPRAARR